MQFETWMPGEPAVHPLMFVGAVIVDDEVKLARVVVFRVDLPQELQELLTWRWRGKQWPLTLPAATFKAAKRVVVP